MMRLLILGCLLLVNFAYAEESLIPLDKAQIDLTDLASLQRGAQIFVNNCLGCHSLKFTRYSGIAKDLGIVSEEGAILDDLVKKHLMFNTKQIHSPMLSSMGQDAQDWFGVVPPDLSLVARSKGADWLYTYMRSFYQDLDKPWGVNNLVFPDVAMPHALLDLQGIQQVSYKTSHKLVNGEIVAEKVVDKLELIEDGSLTPIAYDKMITDLTNFLVYVGEPKKLYRERLGVFVLVFLSILIVFSYLLKREYWKQVD